MFTRFHDDHLPEVDGAGETALTGSTPCTGGACAELVCVGVEGTVVVPVVVTRGREGPTIGGAEVVDNWLRRHNTELSRARISRLDWAAAAAAAADDGPEVVSPPHEVVGDEEVVVVVVVELVAALLASFLLSRLIPAVSSGCVNLLLEPVTTVVLVGVRVVVTVPVVVVTDPLDVLGHAATTGFRGSAATRCRRALPPGHCRRLVADDDGDVRGESDVTIGEPEVATTTVVPDVSVNFAPALSPNFAAVAALTLNLVPLLMPNLAVAALMPNFAAAAAVMPILAVEAVVVVPNFAAAELMLSLFAPDFAATDTACLSFWFCFEELDLLLDLEWVFALVDFAPVDLALGDFAAGDLAPEDLAGCDFAAALAVLMWTLPVAVIRAVVPAAGRGVVLTPWLTDLMWPMDGTVVADVYEAVVAQALPARLVVAVVVVLVVLVVPFTLPLPPDKEREPVALPEDDDDDLTTPFFPVPAETALSISALVAADTDMAPVMFPFPAPPPMEDDRGLGVATIWAEPALSDLPTAAVNDAGERREGVDGAG